MHTIVIEDLHIHHAHNTIFSGLNQSFTGGLWHVIVGRSGCGKTTLLNAIAGLTPHQGHIHNGQGKALTDQLAWIGQQDQLLPWLNVVENIRLGYRLRHQAAPDIAPLLDELDIRTLSKRYPHQLSGGQRQRVALARTLLEQRHIILLDEPFSALDALTRHQLQTLAARLLKGKTVLMITHDPSEALRLADRLYVMAHSPATLTPLPLPDTEPPRALSQPELSTHSEALYHALAETPC
ncbi:ABC transporter ATP-binding protein [Suttonella sp. R2A3]|uniref:ABC transporter ATP-binding protein n=1 Tax=Suttonella sp. R2A3 TaxID=2908648 RepID=UPI001F2A585F|nr:ABC transporter ATP-binding protein [Suttonella sp. R2A3]UJF25283.1 ABC transporter ATP-binding protein [Suttonella sp. R2A3]